MKIYYGGVVLAYFDHNGTNIYYEEHGNLESEKIIAFFNGVMASVSSWQFQVSHFVELGYRVILQDFRGQMMSDKPDGSYSFAEHASDAKALFEHLGIQKLHIVGTSYGGEVAMRFAIDFSDMTESISVIDSVSELDGLLKLFIKAWTTMARKVLEGKASAEDFFWAMTPTIYGNTFIEKNIKLLKDRAAHLNTVNLDYFKGQISLYDTFLNDVDMTDELHKIKCPALILCGDQDFLKPVKFSNIIADKIPDSKFEVLEDCGHVAIFEQYEAVNQAITKFIG